MMRPDASSAESVVETFFDAQLSFTTAASSPGETAAHAGPASTAPSDRPPPARSFRNARYSVLSVSAVEPALGAGGATTATRSAASGDPLDVEPPAFTSRNP